jgi:hypothetical protein
MSSKLKPKKGSVIKPKLKSKDKSKPKSAVKDKKEWSDSDDDDDQESKSAPQEPDSGSGKIVEIDRQFCPNPACEQTRPFLVVPDDKAPYGFSIIDHCPHCGDTKPLAQNECYSLTQ